MDKVGLKPRWMVLPPNEEHRDKLFLHREDDWCPKAGCRPACADEIARMAAEPPATEAPDDATAELAVKVASLESALGAAREALANVTHVCEGATYFASPQWRRNALGVIEKAKAALKSKD